MRLLKAERLALDGALRLVREEVACVRQIIGADESLVPLREWVDAVTRKVDGLETRSEAAVAQFRPWYSGEFARAARSDVRLTKETVVRMLLHFRKVEAALNDLLSALSAQPRPSPLLTAIWNLACDFVAVESGLYGRFPELEPKEGTL